MFYKVLESNLVKIDIHLSDVNPFMSRELQVISRGKDTLLSRRDLLLVENK